MRSPIVKHTTLQFMHLRKGKKKKKKSKKIFVLMLMSALVSNLSINLFWLMVVVVGCPFFFSFIFPMSFFLNFMTLNMFIFKLDRYVILNMKMENGGRKKISHHLNFKYCIISRRLLLHRTTNKSSNLREIEREM